MSYLKGLLYFEILKGFPIFEFQSTLMSSSLTALIMTASCCADHAESKMTFPTVSTVLIFWCGMIQIENEAFVVVLLFDSVCDEVAASGIQSVPCCSIKPSLKLILWANVATWVINSIQPTIWLSPSSRFFSSELNSAINPQHMVELLWQSSLAWLMFSCRRWWRGLTDAFRI